LLSKSCGGLNYECVHSRPFLGVGKQKMLQLGASTIVRM